MGKSKCSCSGNANGEHLVFWLKPILFFVSYPSLERDGNEWWIVIWKLI